MIHLFKMPSEKNERSTEKENNQRENDPELFHSDFRKISIWSIEMRRTYSINDHFSFVSIFGVISLKINNIDIKAAAAVCRCVCIT